jgi:ATP-binding cassette subfamily F protein uup
MEISVASSRLGRKVIEIENLGKSYDGNSIIDKFNYIVLRNDRVGIIGANGSGKSTLINMIAGKIKPDTGVIDIGETVKIGLFSQESYHMNEDLRVIEYIKEGAEILSTAEGERITASQMLEKFLFEPAVQWTPIAKLSGGEKRRLHLLRVLMEAPNVLLLDEPTNDLDIETLTILEDYIENFQGAVIAVSHDRYFLDKIAGRIFSFEEDGSIVKYTGNYSDYKQFCESENLVIQSNDKKNSGEIREVAERTKERALKFTYKEQKEYEQIDTVIADLEDKIQEVNNKIGATAADYVLLQQLMTDKEELEQQLEEQMERWVYLNDLAERIEKSR